MSNSQANEFSGVVNLIHDEQCRLRQYIDKTLLNVYFDIGEIVSKKEAEGTWGQNSVQQLSNYIQIKIPTLKSFNTKALYRMKQFYESYCPGSEFDNLLQSILAQNPENKSDKSVSESPTPLDLDFVSSVLSQFHRRQNEKLPPVVTQIDWASHLEIISRCKNAEEKLFYLVFTASENWTEIELIEQIENNLFESATCQ